METSLRLATRGSPLARWQAQHVADALVVAHPGLVVDLVVVQTLPDRRLDVPISRLGGKGLFTREVQDAVLDGRADAAVHSAKDLPGVTIDGLALAASPPRADARDVLVGATLDGLPTGAQIATGAPRRRAQLAHRRPDLTFRELRGNIGTRLEVARRFPIVMAAAAMDRLGLNVDLPSQVLSTVEMLPQVGQGTIAVECRADDEVARELVQTIDHPRTAVTLAAERAFLAELGGDCDLPCAAYATLDPGGELALEALLSSLDGHIVLRDKDEGADPQVLGRTLARRLLDDAGGTALLHR